MNEASNPTPYSKFANEDTNTPTVPSKIGMLIIYTPALLVSAISLVLRIADGGLHALVSCLLVIHFVKRDLEVLFLHSYSGITERATAIFIGVLYALNACLIHYASGQRPLHGGPHVVVGLGMFALGQAGNFYHHWLLAVARSISGTPKNSSTKRPLLRRGVSQTMVGSGRTYVIPSGGMFELVTMPHYFFELMSWFGIFLVAPRLNILLIFTGMCSYLGGRSFKTTQWYKSKFGDEWPEGRRHLVPFVF